MLVLLTLSSVDPLLRLLETAEEGQESITMLVRSSTRSQIKLVEPEGVNLYFANECVTTTVQRWTRR